MSQAQAETSHVEWRRLHPLTPVLRGGLFVIFLFTIVINIFRDQLEQVVVRLFSPEAPIRTAAQDSETADALREVSEGPMLALQQATRAETILITLGVLLGVLALLLVSYWLSWRVATFRITGRVVETRFGLLTRAHRRAPLERIQSVNVQRPLLARVLGLASVQVVTAGQDGNLNLSYLSHSEAKRVREQILDAVFVSRAAGTGVGPGTGVGGAAAGSDADVPGSGSAALPADEAAHSLPSFAAGAPTAGAPTAAAESAAGQTTSAALGRALAERAEDFLDFDVPADAAAAGALVRVPVGRVLLAALLSWEVLLTALFVVVPMVVLAFNLTGPMFGLASAVVMVFSGVTVLGTVLFQQVQQGFNFTLAPTRAGLRISAGLTALTTETVPLRRIHVVGVYQPLLWRLFGWWRVQMTTPGVLGVEGGNSQGRPHNILLPVGTLEDALRVLEVALPGGGFTAETVAGRPLMLRAPRRAWPVLLAGRSRAGVSLHEEEPLPHVRITRGFFTRSLLVAPLRRVQSVGYYQPPLLRLLGLARLGLHTVPGLNFAYVRGLDREEARGLFVRLAGTVVAAQQRHEVEGSGQQPTAGQGGEQAATSAGHGVRAGTAPAAAAAKEED